MSVGVEDLDDGRHTTLIAPLFHVWVIERVLWALRAPPSTGYRALSNRPGLHVPAVGGRAPARGNCSCLQYFIRTPQLVGLTLQVLHPGPLVGRGPGSLAGVYLCPARPLAERLVVDRQLGRDGLDSFPLGWVLAQVVQEHPYARSRYSAGWGPALLV